MKLYESRLKVKTTIDRMQIDFQCCGSASYKDWWTVGWWGVRWLDTNSKEVCQLVKLSFRCQTSVSFLYVLILKYSILVMLRKQQ